MNARECLKKTMDMSDFAMKAYLGDLADADLMIRPAGGCNHLAWQLGHLINSENTLLNKICPGAGVVLPAGFAEQHNKDTTTSDDKSKFLTKDQYLDLHRAQRKATRMALDKLTDDDLDQAGPPEFKMFPTVGSVFILIANHFLMHAGQFVVVRRLLGKPIVI